MKYYFTEKELNIIKELNLPFDPSDELTDEQEDFFLEALMDKSGFGSEESDAFEDVYSTMVEQYDEYEKQLRRRGKL